MTTLDVYEHGFLPIKKGGFARHHWEACAKLNELHGDRYFYVRHDGLQFREHVGVIQVDGLTIQIHPKADKRQNDSRWRTVLLDMLHACGKLQAKTAGDAHLERHQLNLLEVYFSYFLNEIERLLHGGLVKQYRRETGNVKALKGKLEFAGHVRRNSIHKERFYTTHQVYDRNHRLHQVLFCALEIVEHFTRGTHLADKCRRVLLQFPEVSPISPNEQLLQSIRLTRKTAPYERALELARLIILQHSPDIASGSQRMIALLFDMNKLWEEYVFVQLQRYIRKQRLVCKLRDQQELRFWKNNTLRPDIVIETDHQTFVIDTKWKIPGSSPSPEDLRQVYAYARRWHAERVILLYPGEVQGTAYSSFVPNDFREVDNAAQPIDHCCRMGFVSVINEDGSLKEDLGEHIWQLLTAE